MPIECGDCGKTLGSRKAYAGHMLLAHGKRTGILSEIDAKMQEASQVDAELLEEVSRIKEAILCLAKMLSFHAGQHFDRVQTVLSEEMLSSELQEILSGKHSAEEVSHGETHPAKLSIVQARILE